MRRSKPFVTDHYLQHGSCNFTAKASKRYPELRVLKYARSVFYNNRFDDALLEMRGLIIDAHNRIIVRPFKKSVQLFGTYCQRQPLPDPNRRREIGGRGSKSKRLPRLLHFSSRFQTTIRLKARRLTAKCCIRLPVRLIARLPT